MKNLFIYIILLNTCILSGQNAYYDALAIRPYVKDGKLINSDEAIEVYGSILNQYLLNPLPNFNYATFRNAFTEQEDPNYNPILEDFFEFETGGGASISSTPLSSRKGGLKQIGGLDVTTIANGIAQFMIERAKQELTVAFFERFKKFANENQEFQVLFPKTTDNLSNLLSHRYPDMLPALRTGFFEDIKSTPYHLDDVLELPRYHALLKNAPEVRVAIRSVRLIYELESGESHAADILNSFTTLGEWTDPSASNSFKNFGSGVKLAGVISNSLRNHPGISHSDRAWITYSDMKTLVSNDTIFRLYLGLVYQVINKNSIEFHITNGNKPDAIIPFVDVLAAQKDNLFLVKNKVTEFIALANKVDKILDSIQKDNVILVESRAEAFADYMDVSLDVIDYGLSIGKLFDERLDLDKYTLIARKTNDLYRNIYKQEYTQAINSVIDILDEVRNMTLDTRQAVITETKTILKIPELNINLDENKNGEDLSRRDIKKIDAYVNSATIDTAHLKPLRKLKSLYNFNQLSGKLAKISRYGLFIANMAEADSPEEVASILDNAVLPVGSSSIKKRSSFNLSVQSYLGAFARLGTIDNKNTTAWTSDFGVSAPIGLAFSSGLCSKAGSLSAFVTLLDLGAVVDYQLKSDSIPTDNGDGTTQIVKDYKIELGQIFSPGGYIVYGLPWNLPLALGFGGQYGPGLGKIGDNGETVINNPQWRWNMFLSVDIPFFNIINIHKDRRSNTVTKNTKPKKSK
jgi:hypothetical protein